MNIAVAGGTGTVWRHVVDVARERGHEVRVLSRANGIDVHTGAGLDAALDGIHAVIDTTNLSTTWGDASVVFFEKAARMLLPGASGRAQRDGSLLAAPDAIRGRQTFADWIAALPVVA